MLEMTPQILQDELNYCCDLLVQYGFKFEKPRLYTDSKDSGKFIEIASLNDLARASSIVAVYNDELNGIYTANISMRWPPSATDEEFQAYRHYILLHELVHAIQVQLNPDLGSKDKERPKGAKQKERFETHHAFCEGSAEYIALLIWKKTGIESLLNQAAKRHNQLVSSLKEWLKDSSLKQLSKFYKTDYSPDAWEATAIKYFRRNSGVVSQVFSYTIGYNFMIRLEQLLSLNISNLKLIIQNPPQDYVELLCPNTYSKRIQRMYSEKLS